MSTLLFTVVLLLAELGKAEIAWAVCVAAVALHPPRGLPPSARRVLLVLGVLSVVGLAGALRHAPRDVVRDAWIFSKLPIEIAFGCVVVRALGYGRAIQVATTVGVLVSAEFVARVLVHLPEYLANTNDANRAAFGAGSVLSLVAMCYMLERSHREAMLVRWRTRRAIVALGVILCALAVALSASRTLVVVAAAFVMLKVTHGWRESPFRAAAASLFAVACFLSFLLVASGPGTLQSKFRTAAEELTLGDYASPEDVNMRWRGYESFLALRQFRQLPVAQKIFGGGFGQRVSLDATMTFHERDYEAIPVLHNGYMYVLVKTGYTGIVLFCGSLLLLWRALAKAAEERDGRVTVFPAFFVALLAVTSIVAGGPFNKSAVTPVMILCGIAVGTLRARALPYECAAQLRAPAAPIGHSG